MLSSIVRFERQAVLTGIVWRQSCPGKKCPQSERVAGLAPRDSHRDNAAMEHSLVG